MSKKNKINEDDIAAFQKAVEGTKPLIQKKIRLTPPITRSHSVRQSFPEETFNFSETLDIPNVSGEEFITFKQSGISHKTLRKLRKGQYNVEAKLDLHGMTVEKAKVTLENFLHQCLLDEVRVVLVIHGKGHHSQGPILKNKLNRWLREVNFVLAFCSAAALHGSRGAIYVLLKRSAEEVPFE